MKKTILSLVLLTTLGMLGTQAEAVYRTIVGAQDDCTGCPVPIPLSPTTLCTANCPLRTSFSWTDSKRFWGSKDGSVGACYTSSDGGNTWGGCTTQAFVAGSGAESYAGASDGSVIAIGSIAGTCTIRRSTDKAATWTTVFTDANACQNSGQPGQNLYCLADGRCEYVINQGGTARVYRTSNNGAGWTQGITGTGGNCIVTGAQWDGVAGIMSSENTGCGGGNIAKTFVASGDIWSDSIAWNGTQGDCFTPVIYNGVGRVICSVGVLDVKMYSSAGALVATLVLPGAVKALNSQGPALGFATNTLYVVGQNLVGNPIGVWVSTDNLNTFSHVGSFTGGGAGPQGGNMFKANGCIYVTTGLTPMFGKVC